MALLPLFFSCSSDDDEVMGDKENVQWKPRSVLELLSTTWVYDNPEEEVWEKDEFRESGVFYASYYDKSLYDIQENLNGKYSLDNKGNISGQYKLSSGRLMNLDLSILAISDLELTYKNNTAGLKFTFGKLLDEVSMKTGETVTPDYEKLVPDTITVYSSINKSEMALPRVTGYASHNSKVAEVDENTGKITARSGGRTYIDVITTNGTAVIEVNVTGLVPDYCEFLGLDRDDIYEKFGKSPFSDTEEEIIYLLGEGDFKWLFFDFDTWTGLVKSVSVLAKEETSFTNEAMREYLNSAYYVYEKGTDDTQYAYINADTYSKATAGIIWFPNDGMLLVMELDHDLFKDYSPLLGKTQNEVLKLMADTPFRTTKEYIAYGVSGNKYIGMVSFFYTIDYVNYSNGAQVIILAVKDEANKTDIIDFLNGKYVYMEKDSTEKDRIYLTADGKLVIEYDLLNNQIWYYKNEPIQNAKAIKAKIAGLR